MKIKLSMLLMIFVGFISDNVFASSQTQLIDQLTRCTQIKDNNERLACFDEFALKQSMSKNSLNNQNNVASQQAISELEEAKEAKEAKDIADFSKEDLKKPEEEKGPESITATISKLKKLIRGQWVIYLENGQKWQQQDSGKMKLKVGTHIRLQKGAMGAVYLYKEGSHRSIRVERLK